MADTYVILEADSAAQLADVVNKAIAQGWLPNGGLVAVPNPCDGFTWYQPMIEQTAAMQVLGTAVETYKAKPVPNVTFGIGDPVAVFNHYHYCPSCNQRLGCNENTEDEDLYCWLGLRKLYHSGDDLCETIPAILEHKCAPYASEIADRVIHRCPALFTNGEQCMLVFRHDNAYHVTRGNDQWFSEDIHRRY